MREEYGKEEVKKFKTFANKGLACQKAFLNNFLYLEK